MTLSSVPLFYTEFSSDGTLQHDLELPLVSAAICSKVPFPPFPCFPFPYISRSMTDSAMPPPPRPKYFLCLKLPTNCSSRTSMFILFWGSEQKGTHGIWVASLVSGMRRTGSEVYICAFFLNTFLDKLYLFMDILERFAFLCFLKKKS